MTSTEFLSRMLFEFSAWNAMHDVPFKPRAYELASESVSALGDEVEKTWKTGGIKALKELPGVGQAIAEKIDEYFRTGRVKEYDALKKKFPVDMWGLSRVEGIGPKHILDLWTHLKVKNLTDLEHAIEKHTIRALPRFGQKSEAKMFQGIQLLKKSSGRLLLGYVLPIADEIIEKLSRVKGVERCVYAGSLRRRQETVGDIDLIATTDDHVPVMDAFVSLSEVASVHEKGKTRSSVRLKIGIDADLRVVPDNVFGATLQYFTGDKRHNVLLRELALSKGFTLNEYGLFKLKKRGDGVETGHASPLPVVCKTEEEIYKKLGLDTPPPELRVGGDEIDAAKRHELPDLIAYGSVKGDLQTQSAWTDGSSSIEALARAAKKIGLTYIAITDHTKSLAFVGGLDEKKLARQAKEIDVLNKKRTAGLVRILKGSEVDIKADGSLDLTDEALSRLDWVGVSIHSHFRLSTETMTKRIVTVLSNPNVDCFFHPTGRLIGKREPYALDMAEVIAAAKKYRVAMEIDAHPERSDLKDLHVRMAVEAGIPLVIDTDAHDPSHFKYLPLGEAIARRGWATKRNIVNTKNLKDLRAWLEKKRKRKFWTA